MAASDPARTRAARSGQARPAITPERLLAVVALALVSFGVVMVYSTSSATALLQDRDPQGMVTRHLIYALIGFGLYLACSRMSMERLRRLGPPALAVALVLMVAVLVPSIGMEVNGARSWIGLGPLGQFQPSELAKVALALWVAQAVIRHPERLAEPRGLVPVLAMTGLLAVLLMAEPDLGTAIATCTIPLAMLVVAGARLRHLGGLMAVGVALVGLAIMVAPYRRERFLSFLDPWRDAAGSGFQAVQAQIAVGNGGLHGVGLGEGVQKVFYLPEAHTDMILATVGEELGLIGVLAVLVAFALYAVVGYRIALGARNLHQQVLAAGLTTMVVSQALINVGAVLGVMPITGVPLPFVSYGGSSLIILLGCTGLLVNIGRRSQTGAGTLSLVEGSEGDDRRRRDGRTRDARPGGRRGLAGAGR